MKHLRRPKLSRLNRHKSARKAGRKVRRYTPRLTACYVRGRKGLQRRKAVAMQLQIVAAPAAAPPTTKGKSECWTRGPYKDRDKWRLTFIERGTTWSEIFTTRSAALAAQRAFERKHAQKEELTVSVLADRYMEYQVRKGSKRNSLLHQGGRLKLFAEWCNLTDVPVLDVTVEAARFAYDRYAQRPKLKGKGYISAATHQEDLNVVRCMFTWAVEEGIVEKNPFAFVRPLGRKNRGKKQLTYDAATVFLEVASRMAEIELDPLALAVCLVVSTGARSMEVMSRKVYELDEGGSLLRVIDGKSDNSNRPLRVPEKWIPLVRALAAGRPRDGLLFAPDCDGKRPPLDDALSHRLLRKVEAICKAAGVDRVVTHSFRGLWATLAMAETGDPNMVAKKLGHGSAKVTTSNYMDLRVTGVAQQERVQSRLGLMAPRLDGPIAMSDLTAHLDALAEKLTLKQLQGMVTHMVGLLSQKAALPALPAGSKRSPKQLRDRSESNPEQVCGSFRNVSAGPQAAQFPDGD